MALYPDVQRNAQAEIDAVTGRHRLPDYNDRETLPYINAMVKEIMRWQLVTPVGMNFLPSN
jgi:cytochrome P450